MTHLFEPSVTTRFVRIYVDSYQTSICGNFELYGSDIPEFVFTRDAGKSMFCSIFTNKALQMVYVMFGQVQKSNLLVL